MSFPHFITFAGKREHARRPGAGGAPATRPEAAGGWPAAAAPSPQPNPGPQPAHAPPD